MRISESYKFLEQPRVTTLILLGPLLFVLIYFVKHKKAYHPIGAIGFEILE
jgi:uncharacterized membrane protein